jgi:hypothetical protein
LAVKRGKKRKRKVGQEKKRVEGKNDKVRKTMSKEEERQRRAPTVLSTAKLWGRKGEMGYAQRKGVELDEFHGRHTQPHFQVWGNTKQKKLTVRLPFI